MFIPSTARGRSRGLWMEKTCSAKRCVWPKVRRNGQSDGQLWLLMQISIDRAAGRAAEVMFKLRSSNWSVCVPVSPPPPGRCNWHFNCTDRARRHPPQRGSPPCRTGTPPASATEKGGRGGGGGAHWLRHANLNLLMNYWKCNHVGCVQYVCRAIVTRWVYNYSSLNLTGRERLTCSSVQQVLPLLSFKVFNFALFNEEGSNYCTYCTLTYCFVAPGYAGNEGA